MRDYFIRRAFLIIPTLLGITMLVFMVTRFVPGGPLERAIMEAQQASVTTSTARSSGQGMALSEEQLQQLKEYYGFDKPWYESYALWLGKVVRGDLGTSYRYNEPVWDVVSQRFPISLFYGLVSLVITYLVCIPLGVVKAIGHRSTMDNVTSVLVFAGYAVPGYVLGALLLLFFAVEVDWFPMGGFTSFNFDELTPMGKVLDVLHHATLPLICYLVGSFAVTTMLMKNNLMDNLAADYVRTAVAKGVPFKKAVSGHALRNSLIPIATTFGQNITLLVGGSFLIETIFDIDGFGLLGLTSIFDRDYPVVMGIVFLASLLLLIGNILSDMLVAMVDPRGAFPLMLRFNPLTIRKLKRFRDIRRGYYSTILLVLLTGLSLFAELMVNDKAIIVSYEGQWSFPTYADIKLGAEFGLTGTDAVVPVNYRSLADTFEGTENWVLMPFIPWGPYFNDTVDGVLKAQPPDFASDHFLGTDSTGRDVLSRLVYGFRTAIFFALAFTVLTYLIGVSIGCAMGYFGGIFDLFFQRVIEIWSNIPFLYMVIIVFSVIPSTYEVGTRIGILLLIMVLFSWTGLTYYMRTETYKEKARDYTAAALVLGAGTSRVIFRHILPNTIATMVTFVPFTVVSAITAITALDFLGWGLPPPTPSIGELLKQGTANLTTAPWIVTSAFAALVFILAVVTFIGEAIREALDPRKFTLYR